MQNFDKISGLEVKWPGGYVTGVLDISYIGAAIVKTSKITEKFSKGEIIEFYFSFANGEQDVVFDAEVIREDDKVLAVHFPELTLKARKSLETFLKQKLIGLNTKLVDPKFYIKEQGFDFWFHGPNQTNVFIWGDKDQIIKAAVELNYEVITFEDGKFYSSESKRFLEVPTEDYAYKVNNPDQRTMADVKSVQDVVSLLSQIEDKTGIIHKLSDSILKTINTK